MIMTHEIVKRDDKNHKYCAKIVNHSQCLRKFATVAKNWQILQLLCENCTVRARKHNTLRTNNKTNNVINN